LAKRTKPRQSAAARNAQPVPEPAGKHAIDAQQLIPFSVPVLSNWSVVHSYVLLTVLTLASLIPFSGEAFHVDDTLFLFAAKQIVQHPLDPYGFRVVWNKTAERMADVTMNPPLACYYSALVGRILGWSERALHVAFLLPALALVLGTYRLARHYTRFPLLAALATLLTPGVLVSASSVMCDTMMVALWIWAVILWLEGLEPVKPAYLIGASILIAASALTKYYGMALVPLLLLYSWVRLRRNGWWAAYFVIPIALLLGFELWTRRLYGHGLILGAAGFAGSMREKQQGSTLSHALISLSFAGGCTLSAFTMMPLLWRRKMVVCGVLLAAIAAPALIFNWVDYGSHVGGHPAFKYIVEHWFLIGFQLTLCILTGISIVALGVTEIWAHKKDAESWLLALWLIGTGFFAGFLNWTVNARSVLPLIPAAAILMFRRLEGLPDSLPPKKETMVVAGALAVAAVLAFSITWGDAVWANSAREAATLISQDSQTKQGTVYFGGHWGFQYYMQARGFTPADELGSNFREGDLVIIPENNVEQIDRPAQFDVVAPKTLQLAQRRYVATMSSPLDAGFYSSLWGPLPFVFGPVPPETYNFYRLMPLGTVNKPQASEAKHE
jgi:hypothetical protein